MRHRGPYLSSGVEAMAFRCQVIKICCALDWWNTAGTARSGLCTCFYYPVLYENCTENILHSLKPKARRRHRGPREGGISKTIPKKSSGKQSTRRANMVFADRIPQPLAHFPMAAPLQAQQQSQAQRSKVLEWVSELLCILLRRHN